MSFLSRVSYPSFVEDILKPVFYKHYLIAPLSVVQSHLSTDSSISFYILIHSIG